MGAITLTDGRVLAFEEFGDLSGYPVLSQHGGMAQRLPPRDDDVRAGQAGLRVICVDRPGYGGSTRHRGRTLLGWARDVEDLADRLGLGRLAVVGASAGGPHALAVAHRLGDRVSHGVLVSSLGPMDAPGALRQLPRRVALPWRLRHVPALVSLLFRPTVRAVRRDAGAWVDRLAAQMPSPDREVLRDPAFRPVLEANATKAWGRGTGYMLDDGRALYSWGFDPGTVTQHVDLFHGQADTVAPLPMARALADSLPAARLHVIAGEGHMIGLTRWDELVTALAARLPTPSDR